jgi:peptidoglycan/xylan/chitin deacetylase (PgdA/CDA1 family)
MRDLIPYLQGNHKGKVFGITFDDGFRNVFEHALPVLNELNFTATNYFLSHQLGTSNTWDANQGVPKSELMSAAEMRQWSAAGQEVGSHAMEHVLGGHALHS